MVIRQLYLNKIITWIDKPVTKVITGVRRSGKSYLMQMVTDHLYKKGIRETNVITINFELMKYQKLRNYEELNRYIQEKTVSDTEKTYVFIDEIQYCEQWEYVVASLLAEGSYDIYVTGSNASTLSGDLATNIAGRYIEIEVFPLNFAEFCDFAEQLHWPKLSTIQRFNEYLRYGGFPGISNAIDTDEAKLQYLKGIRDTVVLRDAIQRHNIRDTLLLDKVFLYVLDNVGQIFSAKTVADYLKNIGDKASADSVSTYISALEDAKIIRSAARFDIKGKRIMQRMDKHYICDLGLRYVDVGYRDNDISQMLENVVYMELLTRGYKVFVGKENGYEIDFIAEKGDEKQYYQVCYLLATEDVKNREFRSLLSVKDAYPKTVLSMDLLPIGTVDGVRHKNIIDFLLERNNW